MDVVRPRIPYQFLRERSCLSWREVRFGLVNELLDPQAPVELALDQVGKRAESSGVLLELAGAGNDRQTFELVEQLASGESLLAEHDIRDKWLYLVLAWLYERRAEILDPLQRVEEVYADFGYPDQLAKFVRYMPMDDPDLGTQAANERRLFERWKQYIDEAASKYSA